MISGYKLLDICRCAVRKRFRLRCYWGTWVCGRCGKSMVGLPELNEAIAEARRQDLLDLYRDRNQRHAKVDPPDEIKDLL